MRLFLAIELAPATLDALEAAIAPLREAESALAWVAPAKRHLTLKFLGEVEDVRVPAIAAAMDGLVARQRPFSMQLARVGAFPNFRRARVVWIGVEQEPRLELLHHDVEVAAEQLGFEVEGRAFRPHVTLARVRNPMAEEIARRLARAAKAVDFASDELVAGITLFESALGRGGTAYRRVHVATLGGR